MLNARNWTVLSLMLGLLCGCKSADKKDYYGEIVTDLSGLQDELKDASYQIDTVTNSLNRLAKADGDLRKPLREFTAAVSELDAISAKIQGLRQNVTTKEAAYQKSSEKELKEIKSPDLRRSAEQGRTSVNTAFANLEQSSDSLGDTYREWESTVKSIQSSLQADLSPENLKTLESKIQAVTESTPKVKEAIRRLTSQVEEITAEMNPKG